MTIESVTYIADDQIRINLSFPVKIDSDFLSAANYLVTLHAGSDIVGDPVAVQVVLPIEGDVYVSSEIYLRTTKHTLGAEYEVNYISLSTSTGESADPEGNVPYQARVTKTMSMLKSLPSHFDKRDTALIRNIITAISLNDDTIGGSRNDSLQPVAAVPE